MSPHFDLTSGFSLPLHPRSSSPLVSRRPKARRCGLWRPRKSFASSSSPSYCLWTLGNCGTRNMPSPMALNPPSPTPSMFAGKKSNQSLPLQSAASYLTAVSQMDARARSRQSTPNTTPALSLSSTAVSSSEEDSPVDDELESDGLSTPKTPPTSEQVFTTVHAEFGHCANEQYRHTSKFRTGSKLSLVEQEPPYYVLIMTYLSYIVLICIGHIRDFVGKRFKPFAYKHLKKNDVRFFLLHFINTGYF